jgi:hypothetical protein
MRRLTTTATILALLAAIAVLPAAAQASQTQTTYFEAPRTLKNPAKRQAALDTIASLGVHALRLVLYWNDVAPHANSRLRGRFDETAPGAYNWGQYDAIVDAARARGWQVLLTVSGPVPRWATSGRRDHVTRPRTRDFQAFMTAVGRHFAGRVQTYSIWNEPNHPQFLDPQYVRGRPASPAIYRGLLLAGIAGLRAGGQGSVPVLMGDTAPRGTGHDVAPLTFLRGALCLDGNYHRARGCAMVHVAGYAHHAYTTIQGPFFKPPGKNDVTIGVLSRLTRALDRAAAAGAIPRRLPIWLTEFGIQSVPDPFVGVSLMRQNEYRAISEKIAARNPRVVAFSQYLLQDDPALPGVPKILAYGGFQSGLETASGAVKPALSGFRLPLVVGARKHGVSLWGLVRPATGPTQARVQYNDGNGWRDAGTVTTDALGYWAMNEASRVGRRWRVLWTAPDGTVYSCPAVRSYVGV